MVRATVTFIGMPTIFCGLCSRSKEAVSSIRFYEYVDSLASEYLCSTSSIVRAVGQHRIAARDDSSNFR